MREAFDLVLTLVRGITMETLMAAEVAQIAHDLAGEGLAAEAAGLRAIVRHHRAKVVQMRALLGGLEVKYGKANQA